MDGAIPEPAGWPLEGQVVRPTPLRGVGVKKKYAATVIGASIVYNACVITTTYKKVVGGACRRDPLRGLAQQPLQEHRAVRALPATTDMLSIRNSAEPQHGSHRPPAAPHGLSPPPFSTRVQHHPLVHVFSLP